MKTALYFIVIALALCVVGTMDYQDFLDHCDSINDGLYGDYRDEDCQE